MHSKETPCACPKYGWLGMYHGTDKKCQQGGVVSQIGLRLSFPKPQPVAAA